MSRMNMFSGKIALTAAIVVKIENHFRLYLIVSTKSNKGTLSFSVVFFSELFLDFFFLSLRNQQAFLFVSKLVEGKV